MALAVTSVADEEWDAFCATSPGAWFWHTTAWRDYTLAYRPDLRSRLLDFGVGDEGTLVAIVPLMLESHPGGPAFTFGGGWCWAPALAPGLAPARADAVLRFALDRVDELAREHQAGRCAYAITPLAPGGPAVATAWMPAALRAGYVDASRASQVVDLRVDAEGLLRDMSKGHRAAVGRANKSIGVDVVTSSDDGAFARYQAMHQRAAGRATRPQRTFDLMRAWLSTGNAALLVAHRDDRDLGFAYILRHGTGAYYASAANDPADAGEPVGHALQWAAMTWLKAAGVTTYELGLQPYGAAPHDVASDKELNIARFKRGFGGFPVPLVVSERHWA